MTRYFMHLRDGSDELIDKEGQEFSDLAALRRSVLLTARDLICGDVEVGVIDFRFRIDAADESGDVIYTLPFEHAVSIIPDKAETASASDAS